ncbi:subclass B1 metallo-beta-lactamase [uncultured Dokdonia sp.]|uniref:subclass B1 metallo-beta-lactamase n=1 Tax=uncultured Dokdonia sp. TaxID=575653 RepID=UPI0026125CAF|nr:subclass B1 metallo-beta-lactamase [uncultured Dokdonia sp.]
MIEKFLFRLAIFCLFTLFLSSCMGGDNKFDPDIYVRPLEIVKLSENKYQHISYLKLKQSDFYPCNGYVYISNGEAIIFDSPVDEVSASQLIKFLQKELNVKIVGVVVNHSHTDAAGGLKAFAKANIPSYASSKTAQILAKDSKVITYPFETKQEIKVGNTTVENTYFGPAHTQDNIVSYIQEEHILYGGCMIKSLHASQGNIKDADTQVWSKTVKKVKEAYPEVQTIIPGHGGKGDISLLDYTIELFTTNDTLGSNLE